MLQVWIDPDTISDQAQFQVWYIEAWEQFCCSAVMLGTQTSPQFGTHNLISILDTHLIVHVHMRCCFHQMLLISD